MQPTHHHHHHYFTDHDRTTADYGNDCPFCDNNDPHPACYTDHAEPPAGRWRRYWLRFLRRRSLRRV